MISDGPVNLGRPKKISETDLFYPVRDYLIKNGYAVNAEVKDCDLTARKGQTLIVVELKTALTVALLIQAVKRQRAADSVYIAIPMPKSGIYTRKWKDLCYLVRRLGLGLLVISFLESGPRVTAILHPGTLDPRQNRHLNRKKRNAIIEEIDGRHQDDNVGGVAGRKLITAYRENAIQIALYLKECGPLSPRQLKALGTGAKTGSILRNNYYGWFERIARGLYQTTSQGNHEITAYPELIDYYRRKLLKQKAADGV